MPSLEGWPTKVKEAATPHEVRLTPMCTNPAFQCLGMKKVVSNYNSILCKHKKLRLDCMKNDNILYCPSSDCVKTFLSEVVLKNHTCYLAIIVIV